MAVLLDELAFLCQVMYDVSKKGLRNSGGTVTGDPLAVHGSKR